MNAVAIELEAYEVTETEPLFRSARAALIFMATCEGNPGRPLQNRMSDKTSGSDLVGLDRPGLAGMIKGVIRLLGPLAVAVLEADVTPPTKPCSCRRACCKGQGDNHEWLCAIDEICQHMSQEMQNKASYSLRSALAKKIYHGGGTIPEIAKRHGLHDNTVSNYLAEIRVWLKGCKANRNGPAVEGVDPTAWAEAETLFRNRGIVG